MNATKQEVDGLVAYIEKYGDIPFSSAVDWLCRERWDKGSSHGQDARV